MADHFDLEQYLSAGVEMLVKDIVKATLKHPGESVFFAKYALAAKKAEGLRRNLEAQGEHIPSFLIASITGKCNLRCAGCYDRANHGCGGHAEMSGEAWGGIFAQAQALGVSAILLAGGEPLMRPDVLAQAARYPAILFPVFTNGTMLQGPGQALFLGQHNLIPIISIEGDQAQTDARRGQGIYDKTLAAMKAFRDQGRLFGASITVTSDNLATVTHESFIKDLRGKGCKAVVFVEYVPVENPGLALDDADRETLAQGVERLRQSLDMIVISFPGDEKASGGCMAAGRGFFHINAHGGAEPCPFSPYSDTNLGDTPLREALRSPLFTKLRESGALLEEHTGGCTLFAQADWVKDLAGKA